MSPTLVVGILLAAAVSACERSGDAPPPPEPPVAIARANAVRVERETIQTGPRIAGTLDPRERATVRAEASGSLTEVTTELGQTVKRGELLARIEHATQTDALASARAAVAAAKAQLALAKREAERAAALVRAGALARRELDNARSAAVAAEAQVRQARAQRVAAETGLANTRVVSPMSGVVSEAPVRRGDVVSPGSLLFTVIDPSSVRLTASVPSEHLASLEVGVPVAFQVRGYPDRTFTGHISRLAPAADPATRQLEIIVDIPNESGELVAGLFAEGRLASTTMDALVVPLAAIDTTGETSTVTRVVDGVVERTQVQLGARDTVNERVQILEGLETGDIVLLRSARTLDPGTRVSLPPGLSGAGGGRAARAPESQSR